MPLLALLLLLPLAPPVQGHAVYVSSDPPDRGVLAERPTQITIRFSEPIQPVPGIRVTDADGRRYDAGTPVVSREDPRVAVAGLRPLRPGIYTVSWAVVASTDGHFTTGSFVFGVLAPDGSLPGAFPARDPFVRDAAVSPVEAALRVLSFLGLAVALGAAAFALLVWPSTRGAPEGTSEEDAWRQGSGRLLLLALLGALAFAGGVVAWWGLVLSALPPPDLAGIVATRFQASLVARLVVGIALVGLLAHAWRRGTAPRTTWAATLALGMAAVVAAAGGSHAASLRAGGLLGGVAQGVHLLGAALWIGGLGALLGVRSVLARAPATLAAVVLRGFARWAVASAALVVASGTFLLLLLVGSLEALAATGYGWLVLVKTALLALMVALGVSIRRFHAPRSSAPLPSAAFRRLHAEAALGVVVVALAGVLAASVPPALLADVVPPGPLLLEGMAEDVRVELEVFPYPQVPGTYVFSLLLWQEDGEPYREGERATLTFRLRDGDRPSTTVALLGPHGHHFGVETDALDAPGSWEVVLRVEGTDRPPLEATFDVELRA